MDLGSASVFCDFDGTISTTDVAHHLLDRFADPGWREISAAYRRGEISSRECLGRLLALLPADRDQLVTVAREVPLDPDAEPLIGGLQAAGAEVTVVSDGFGFYVEDRLAAAGLDVPVLTNQVDFDRFEMRWPNIDLCCACSTCGTCKQAPIREAGRRGRTTVFIGDGTSDRKAVLLADVVFATGDLADYCDDWDIDHTRFDTLADVRRALGV